MTGNEKEKQSGVCHEDESGKKQRRCRRVMVLLPMLVVALSVSAFATSATGFSAITGQMDEVTTLVGTVFTLLTGNAYFSTFLAVGLLSAGIGIFRRVKRAARH